MKITEIDVRGVKMKLSTHTKSLELCARMNYETENLDFIDNMREGATFYDLGACEGRFSIYAGLKGFKVVAFEPEQMNFETLEQNIRLNVLEHLIKPVNAGISSADGSAKINIGQPWAGGHQKVVEHSEVRSDVNFDFKSKQEIKVVSLDSFIKSNNLPDSEYLKVDIDGSEIPFLDGAADSLNSAKKIIFELSKDAKNYNQIIERLDGYALKINDEFMVPNEPGLYNIIFKK